MDNSVKPSFSGNYLCTCVEKYCNEVFQNGIDKIGGYPITDDLVLAYFNSRADGHIFCNNSKELNCDIPILKVQPATRGKVMKVISVKDMLPEINEPVMAKSHAFWGVAIFDGTKWYDAVLINKPKKRASWWNIFHQDETGEVYVTHWISFYDQPERLSEKTSKEDAIV